MAPMHSPRGRTGKSGPSWFPMTVVARKLVAQAALAAAAVLLAALGSVAPARADVQYRSCSQANGSAVALVLFLGTSFSMSAPAGTQTGDVLVLTLRQSQAWGIIFSSFTPPESQSRAWTPLLTSGEMRSYYRVRQAGDPASYTLFSPLLGVAASTSISASMSAFSGADTSNPIAAGSAQGSASGLGTHALPNAAVPRQGSLRYTGVSTNVSSSFSYGAPLAGTCTNQTASRSTSGSHEAPVAPHTTASRDVTIGGSGGPSALFQTYVVQPPMPPCAPGTLSMVSQPASVSFPATTLNGLDQTQPGLATFRVSDMTEAHAGWKLTGTSTTFISGGGHTLPVTATTVTGAAASAAPGNCSLPSNGVSYPLTLPAGAVAPAAVTLVNAAADSGAGPTDLDVALSLRVPYDTHAGTYSSTWTFTLAAGP